MLSASIPTACDVTGAKLPFRTFQNIPQDFAIVPVSILDAAEVTAPPDYLG